MLRYIIKRVLMLIPVMIGITLIVFTIMELTPGDPVRLMLGNNATEEAVQLKRAELGLNEPFIVRYGKFLVHAVTGNFGHTYATGSSVTESILRGLPYTALLTVSAMLLIIFIGIPLGVISAAKEYSWFDLGSMIFSMILIALPGFWLGLMLILLLSVQLHLLPSFGFKDFRSLVMPAITLAAAAIAFTIRLTRTAMLEVIRQDYIRTARAKGASESRIILRHVMRNSMIPVVTSIGLFFGTLLGSTIIIESVFAFPGVGLLLLGGIMAKDTPTVLGCVTVLALCFCLINLAVDLCYALIDPRLKSQYKSKFSKSTTKKLKKTRGV